MSIEQMYVSFNLYWLFVNKTYVCILSNVAIPLLNYWIDGSLLLTFEVICFLLLYGKKSLVDVGLITELICKIYLLKLSKFSLRIISLYRTKYSGTHFL
jgi:hypothetical protein